MRSAAPGPSVLVFYENGYEQVCDLVRQIFALHGRNVRLSSRKVAADGILFEEGLNA